jgi:hypothetical protein
MMAVMVQQELPISIDDRRKEVDRLWAEHGWPGDLLVRVRQVQISEEMILRWFRWGAPVERAQEEVGWAEKLRDGTLRFRQLTFADNEAFCELWANSPEQLGDWDVTVERGPNGFASFELQERPVLNGIFDGGVMVACVSFSLRHTIVGGTRISVRYGQAMRVHSEHRGKAYAHWVRSLPWAIGLNIFTRVQYDYIRGHNMTMEKWNKKFMPNVESVTKREDDVPGTPVTVLQIPVTGSAIEGAGVRRATPGDYARCAELINRTHAGRDLFVPYTAEWLTNRLEFDVPPNAPWRPPYSLDDFWVLQRGGAVVACAGLWDKGRDLRERWRHRETGQDRVVESTIMLDIGFAEGAEDAMAALIEHLVGVTHKLGRDQLTAPLEYLPGVASLLAKFEPVEDTRYLQWRADDPALTTPAHLDLVYW